MSKISLQKALDALEVLKNHIPENSEPYENFKSWTKDAFYALDYATSVIQELTVLTVGKLVSVVKCGECKFSRYSATQPYRYTCINVHAPCRGRCADADFGCLYGQRKEQK